jgi:peptidoglycan/xylan/chitin deacetylase (PgdA/CDA1 family)
MSFTTLMYHEIREKETFHPEQPSHIDVRQAYDDVLPPPLFITLENFREQMAYLYENNYHTLTLSEIKDYYYNHKRIPEHSVLLTFDDCYQSIKKYAYPLLQKYHFHAVAFVVTGWLHSSPKEFNPDKSVCMTVDDLLEMNDVFEYANHTDLFHTRTNNTIGAIMSSNDEEFSGDLDSCSENSIIQAKDVFAYPFGFYIDRNVALLRKKGFQLAFTSEDGKNDEATDPLLLKRNAIPYFIDINTFQKIVE